MSKNLVLLKGDCLELMKKIPDKSIDMILCDLPYGTSALKWDNVIPISILWSFYKRIIKNNGAIVIFGSEPFSSLMRTSNLDMYKYDWKWEKPNGANFLNFKYQPAKVYEDIMVFGKMATSYSKKGNMKYYPQMEIGKPYKGLSGKQKKKSNNSTVRSEISQVVTDNNGTRYPRSIQKFKLDKDKLHPTQKPVALLEYLIKTYTNEGDLILDNCMGSGSTGVAAVNTNRKFIGMELDKEYFDIAKNRISEHIAGKEGVSV
ncbi:DNA-methyltransferase [Liquorilactobacillus hordei]|uniref:Methyltransferase n=1 Tax=Liquorilactobacillus hordei DSM 19519 TaxID=1423759 RepID=A0A0R1MQE6_9LACO|nr:site-specific DNA-methyltransferase [Liquorilactobacillus hordei]KRL07956.1 phage DNA methylase [Liquorilactobacillus hordei DSM 19519]QYH51099.1 site-specific DNA-methyltransferase [Liquorilactobacillus hordei DSM 19519]